MNLKEIVVQKTLAHVFFWTVLFTKFSVWRLFGDLELGKIDLHLIYTAVLNIGSKCLSLVSSSCFKL